MFHVEHRRRYGYSNLGKPIEVVSARLRAWIPSKAQLPLTSRSKFVANRQVTSQPTKSKAIFSGKNVQVELHEREALKAGMRFRGPAIVTEYSATTVVPPGWNARIDSRGNLILQSNTGTHRQAKSAKPPK